MSGDEKDDKVIGRIPSSGRKADHRDDGDTWGGQGVGVPHGGGGNGRRGTPPHWRVHQEGQATIAENVAFRPIYELCVEAHRMPGTSRMVRW